MYISQSFGDAGPATKHAIDAGYRHFDTAYLYGNEAEVGSAIREKIADGTVKREEIFIVTKVCIKAIQHKTFSFFPIILKSSCRYRI